MACKTQIQSEEAALSLAMAIVASSPGPLLLVDDRLRIVAAFPDGRPGRIVVECAVRGPNWSLSVTDDGVGIPADVGQLRHGMGPGIVQALARQLEAVVVVERANPGARTVISHTQIALIDPGDGLNRGAAAVTRPAAWTEGSQ